MAAVVIGGGICIVSSGCIALYRSHNIIQAPVRFKGGRKSGRGKIQGGEYAIKSDQPHAGTGNKIK